MKYILKKIIKFSSINLVYVSSIVYLDLKYQYLREFKYKEQL